MAPNSTPKTVGIRRRGHGAVALGVRSWRLRPQAFHLGVTACHLKRGDRNPEKHPHVTVKTSRHVTVKSHSQRGAGGIWPWTQTGMPIGIRSFSQIQSIAGTLTRTQPCEAG